MTRENNIPSDPEPAQLQPLITLFNQGQLGKALALTANLLRQYPRSASLHNFHGIVCTGLGQLDAALSSYARATDLQPEFVDAHRNLANTQLQSGNLADATASLRRIAELSPESADAHYNYAVTLQSLAEFESAIPGFRRALELNPDIPEAHNNLGLALFATGDLEAALQAYREAIACKPGFAEAYLNAGIVLRHSGALTTALEQFNRAIELKPELIDAYNHSGNVHLDRADLAAARQNFSKALDLDPTFAEACWNLAGTAEDREQCLAWLDRCLEIDPKHANAALLKASVLAMGGDINELEQLRSAGYDQHPFMRSFDWVLGQPTTPELYYNRWAFFDAVVTGCDPDRPFYEFGVWRGQSFRYLMRTFPKGFGFDTFSGLPEDWHEKSRGSYSSKGQIPDIPGGEFIVGEFAETLPQFFSEQRPTAALINFDADLYSSTLCALQHANSVIDEKTVLVFDELLMNEHWEYDEYRALLEFCQQQGRRFEVLAVCFFSKQVAVRLVDA